MSTPLSKEQVIALLKKYIALVGESEGISFIPENGPLEGFSDDEISLLRRLDREASCMYEPASRVSTECKHCGRPPGEHR